MMCRPDSCISDTRAVPSVLLVPAARRLVESERAQERAVVGAARHAQRRAAELQGILGAFVLWVRVSC